MVLFLGNQRYKRRGSYQQRGKYELSALIQKAYFMNKERTDSCNIVSLAFFQANTCRGLHCGTFQFTIKTQFNKKRATLYGNRGQIIMRERLLLSVLNVEEMTNKFLIY